MLVYSLQALLQRGESASDQRCGRDVGASLPNPEQIFPNATVHVACYGPALVAMTRVHQMFSEKETLISFECNA